MHLILNFFPQLKNNFYNPPSPHLGKLANSQNFTEVYKKIITFLTEKKAALFSGFKFTDIIEFSALDTGVIPDMVKMVLTPFFEENKRSLYDLLCTLQNNHHNESSNNLSPYKVITILLTISVMLYVISL